MGKKLQLAPIAALFVLAISSCGTTPPTVPVVPPSVSVDILKTYPAGSVPTIRKDSTGYIISYYDYGDAWLMKTDADGDCVWARSYRWGAAFSDYVDTPNCVAAASDGYYITGDSHPLSGASGDYHDFFAIKTDLSGNEIWRHRIDNYSNFGANVIADTDGAVFSMIDYTGSAQSVLIKYSSDSEGTTLWTKSVPLGYYEMPGIVKTSSGYFFSGMSAGAVSTEMISGAGTGGGQMNYALTWVFGGAGPVDSASCAVQGGFATVRTCRQSLSAQGDIIVMASNTTGAVVSHRVFGRSDKDETAAGIANDGKWTLIAVSINETNSVPYIIILDQNGNSAGEITLTGAKSVTSIIAGAVQGKFIVLTSSDYMDTEIREITIQ